MKMLNMKFNLGQEKLNTSQVLLAISLLVFFLAYWKRLFINSTMPFNSDTLFYFYPSWKIGRQLLNEGFVVLWDPFRNMGQPFLAAPQNHALYPLRLILPFVNYLNYVQIYIVFHTFLASIYGYRIARHLKGGRTAALLTALGFGFNGLMLNRANFPTDFATMAWGFPVVFYFLQRRPILMAFCLTLQWLAGYPPFFLVTGFITVLLALIIDNKKENFLLMLKSYGLFLGLGAVQILPFLEMLQQANKGHFENLPLSFNSLDPLELLQHLTLPSFLLKPMEKTWENMTGFFLGPVFLGLFAVGVWKGRRRTRFFAGAAITFLIMASGTKSFLYGSIPFITYLRTPSNWILGTIFFSVLVAARGVDVIRDFRLKSLLIIIAGLDLFGYTVSLRVPWGDMAFIETPSVMEKKIRAFGPDARVFHFSNIVQQDFFWDRRQRETWILMKELLTPSYGAAFYIKEAASHGSLVSQRNIIYRKRLEAVPLDSPLYDYAGVRFIVKSTVSRPYQDFLSSDNCSIVENPDPKPRVFNNDNQKLDPILISQKPGHAFIEAGGPGLIVLSESFYPGWKVTVDGISNQVEAFENYFLSVKIGEGRHKIHFYYRPPSFLWGLAISSLTFLILVGRLREYWFKRGNSDRYGFLWPLGFCRPPKNLTLK